MQVITGKALKRRRVALDMSLRELAENMGHPNAYTFIGRMERGLVTTCTPEFATKLATNLHRDVEELFTPRVSNSVASARPTRSRKAAA